MYDSQGSESGKLNAADVKKILMGALLAAAAGAVAALQDWWASGGSEAVSVNQGLLVMLVVTAVPVILNTARKWITDTRVRYMVLLLSLGLCLGSTAMADTILLLDGGRAWTLNTVTRQAAPLYVDGVVVLSDIPAPPIVPPVIVPPVLPPTTDLESVAHSALAAVPQYEKRDSHVRGLAFSLQMITPSIRGSSKPVAESLDVLLAFTKSATQDAPQWATFFATVDPHLRTCTTNAQLADAFSVLQKVFADSIPPADDREAEVFGAFDSYGLQGLDPAFFMALLKLLIPLLMQWLA